MDQIRGECISTKLEMWGQQIKSFSLYWVVEFPMGKFDDIQRI